MSDSLQPHGLYSLPGSSLHGILQARIMEWVAIPFSRGSFRLKDRTWIFHIAGRFFLPSEPPGKWSEVTQSCLTLCDPMDCSLPGLGFSRQEYWSGLPFPSPGDLPDPGIEPGSPALGADALTSEPPGKPMSNLFSKYLYGAYLYWKKNSLLCIWNPNVTGHPIFLNKIWPP